MFGVGQTPSRNAVASSLTSDGFSERRRNGPGASTEANIERAVEGLQSIENAHDAMQPEAAGQDAEALESAESAPSSTARSGLVEETAVRICLDGESATCVSDVRGNVELETLLQLRVRPSITPFNLPWLCCSF